MSKIEVELAYAEREQQHVVSVEVEDGARVLDVIAASNIHAAFPALQITSKNVGIFGKVVAPETRVKAGDRVEIYRPLAVDPIEARRERAKNAKK